MAVAVASVATGDAGGISTIAALDASQQAGLRQELAVLQQLYFTPECEARLGLPLDPEGGASRAAAQGKCSTVCCMPTVVLCLAPPLCQDCVRRACAFMHVECLRLCTLLDLCC